MSVAPLPAEFFRLPTLELARQLLGKTLVRDLAGVRLTGRIVEVEAYHQDGDMAAHSFGGKTARNQVMFGPPGYLYVYFIYGMHFCMNVVSEGEGIGAAVLIRGIEPLAGVDEMRRRRGLKIKPRDLTNGPAKCCQAFGIDRGQDGALLACTPIYVGDGEAVTESLVITSPRIGITKSQELPWRFYIKGNPYVSR